MSRFISVNPKTGNEVAYGFDHAIGYFMDEFSPTQDEPVVEVSSLFNGRNACITAFVESGAVAPAHIDAIMLDLPF